MYRKFFAWGMTFAMLLSLLPATGLTCADIEKGETPAPTATATFGDITYSYSKDGETWGDWDSIYSESDEYQVKAVTAMRRTAPPTAGTSAPNAAVMSRAGPVGGSGDI